MLSSMYLPSATTVDPAPFIHLVFSCQGVLALFRPSTAFMYI